ncbi:MAG: fibronectin type III domain-containing protein [Acidobacteria bacterium]|nr:fibronectin type III domain-containing protein [Acidobacteriota bacterium]
MRVTRAGILAVVLVAWASAGSLPEAGPAGDSAVPSVPTGFTATPTSPYAIHLAWNANPEPDIHHYLVQNNNSPIPSIIAEVTGTLYDVTGLRMDRPYAFSLKAVNNGGEISGATPTVTVYTPVDPAYDLNLDGHVNTIDLALWRAHASGNLIELPCGHDCDDIDSDGHPDGVDLVLLSRAAAD